MPAVAMRLKIESSMKFFRGTDAALIVRTVG
jgi:hypothetical protein